MHENIRHLINGGTLLTINSLEKIKLDAMKIVSLTTGNYEDFSLTELEEYSIYVSPEEKRIVELEAIVKRQSEEIQKMLTKPGIKRKHLIVEEVAEIEEMLINGISTQEDIMSNYNIGTLTYTRILKGIHGKSSQEYKDSLKGE